MLFLFVIWLKQQFIPAPLLGLAELLLYTGFEPCVDWIGIDNCLFFCHAFTPQNCCLSCKDPIAQISTVEVLNPITRLGCLLEIETGPWGDTCVVWRY